uniref:SGNH hydrolase-type esterase domain-containing protein n=1 Tax=Acanthochromis polyacanthus TaxID=80966 RepID=A0A3Q1GLT4_9TELE
MTSPYGLPLSAALQDTAPWDPSCPRRSSCSTPNRQRSWTEVVIRGKQKTPVRAISPPLSLSNRFMALSQIDEKPACGEGLSSAPAVSSVSSGSNGLAALLPLLDTETAAHSAGLVSLPVAAVRRRSGSLHCPRVAGLPHLSPPPLFSPTTLIIGDSIVRNVRFFNATTRCFPGATVAVILNKLPELLQSIPASICRVIIHVGTNDTTRRQSELTKRDFMDLFGLLKSCGKSVFISRPIPTLSRGAERFSRLLSLSVWLWHTCTTHNLNFIHNFNLFWNRPAFYRRDRLHLSTLGSSVLTDNIHHVVQSIPAV